jgi:hypothetical protein
MKKITILLTVLLFAFTTVAQEKINWLTTAEFEKALKKEEKNCFIFIEDDRMNENMPKEKLEEMKKYIFRFLEDKDLVKSLNKNFICYKFNPATESLNFQGKEYKKIEAGPKTSHEFTDFLSANDRKILPVIVLRDPKFNLFEYQATSIGAYEELQILIDAERLKVNYITEKLGADHNIKKRSVRMLETKTEQLKKSKEDKIRKSVLPGRQTAKKISKTLTYFLSGSYKEKDLESFIKTK